MASLVETVEREFLPRALSRRPGCLLFPKEVAVLFATRCRELGLRTLGLDGFWIRADGRYQIDQDHCLDVSNLPAEAGWESTLAFVAARVTLPLAFEFVFDDNARTP